MKNLEARRKALAAEAEVYRQTMKLEIQNLRLYARQRKQQYTAISPRNPLFMIAAPLVTAFLGRSRRGKKAKFFAIALFWFQTFKRFAPLLPGIIAAFKQRRESRKAFRQEQQTPAATI